MIILSLNVGSSSLRYSLYDFTAAGDLLLTKGEEERIGSEDGVLKTHKDAVEKIFKIIHDFIRINNYAIDAVGSRVVHGGAKFYQPTIIETKTLQGIRELKDLAPLHNDIDADILEISQKAFPSIPTVAVFDTGFHQTLPAVSAMYALPQELSAKYNLKRYGFHGIAHQYVSEAALKCLGRSTAEGTRVITCHLGSGASICAIKDGKSMDTSMGLTPLEGLIMGTRSGDLDPGLIIYLIKECGITPTELETMLNHKSGLLGLSKLSADVRDLEVAASSQNNDAEFALNAFAYRVSKYIGSYVVALGGVDAIAFSGGIGENSISMRSRICEKISCLGLQLDNKANAQSGSSFCITSKESPISAWVIHADENLQIAKLSYEVVSNLKGHNECCD